MKDCNYFIDTNIFLRTLLKDDEKTFPDCLKFLNQIKTRRIKAFTSNLILAEINWTLSKIYKFPKEKVIEGLISILKLKNLKIIDKFNPFSAVEIYKNLPVKFIDTLISSNPLIFQKKTIVISYDKDFDRIGIKRKEPKEIIK